LTELVFERLCFKISKEEENDAPPRRKEIFVWNPDGSTYGGPLISASAWGSFDRCQRIWAFDKIDKVPRVETSYQKEGKRLHEELLEGWLLRREMPVSRSILDGGVLRLFPAPRKGLRAEECFVLRVYVKGKRGEGVVFWGFKDCEYEVDGQPRVNDLKTTSDLRWRKTPGELQNDVQCVVYAADRLAEYPHAKEIRMDWVYMTRNKPYKSETTEVTITRELMLAKMSGFLPKAQEIQKIALQASEIPKIKTEKGSYAALSFPASTSACQMYGGCDYKKQGLCEAGKGLKGLRSHFLQDKESKHKKSRRRLLRAAPDDKREATKKEERKMGLLEDLAAGAGPEAATKAISAAKTAETVEISADDTQKASTPKPPRKDDAEKSAASAVQAAVAGKPGSTLAGLVRQARGEPQDEKEEAPAPAEGINPPDARDPEEVQAEAAAPKETAATKKKREKEEKAAAAEEAPAGRPAGSKNKKVALTKALILLVDAVPLKGVQAAPVEDLLASSRATVETDAGMDYRLIQFDGPKMFGAQLLEDLKHQDLKGFFHVSSKTTEKEVLDSLIRCADVVIKGGF